MKIKLFNDRKGKYSSWECTFEPEGFDEDLLIGNIYGYGYGSTALEAYEEFYAVAQNALFKMHKALLESTPPAPETEQERKARISSRSFYY